MSTGSTTPAAVDWTGRRLRLTVERVAHGGHCVARSDGRVVFVRHALPGEVVTAVVTDDPGRAFCRADAVEIEVAAAGRVAPPCRYAGPGGCGGCDFQHADAETQRSLKAAVVEEALDRFAGIRRSVAVEGFGDLLHWRTRMQYAVTAEGRLGLRRHRSSDVVPLTSCAIAVPQIGDERALAGHYPGAASVEMTATDDRPIIATVSPSHRRTFTTDGAVATYRAGGRSWQVTGGGFWQVHPAAADALAGAVSDYASARPGERVLDLYAGVGLFGGVLAEQVGRSGSVVCIESAPSAVADARTNLADLPQVRVRRGGVTARILAQNAPRGADIVVLDPPRAGAKAAVCQAIANLRPRVVCYVACDPVALARDLATFADAGYELDEIRAFDLFPMTQHVECVVRVARSGGAA